MKKNQKTERKYFFEEIFKIDTYWSAAEKFISNAFEMPMKRINPITNDLLNIIICVEEKKKKKVQ